MKKVVLSSLFILASASAMAEPQAVVNGNQVRYEEVGELPDRELPYYEIKDGRPVYTACLKKNNEGFYNLCNVAYRNKNPGMSAFDGADSENLEKKKLDEERNKFFASLDKYGCAPGQIVIKSHEPIPSCYYMPFTL